jgi:hypothetical protein
VLLPRLGPSQHFGQDGLGPDTVSQQCAAPSLAAAAEKGRIERE